jgi:hypothetical protein
VVLHKLTQSNAYSEKDITTHLQELLKVKWNNTNADKDAEKLIVHILLVGK